MVNVLLRGPLWFFGVDAAFELFSFVVLLLVFLFSFRAYKLTKDYKYKYFTAGFFALAAAFLSKAVTDLWLAFAFVVRKGVAPPSEALERVGEVFLAGYLVFIFLSLMAGVLLVCLTSKIREKKIMFLLALLVLAPFLLTSSYSKSFYSLSLLMYSFIAVHFVRNFFDKRSFSSGCVASAFSLIAVAQGMFLFDILQHRLYVVAHLSQLAGFVLLLCSLLKVLFRQEPHTKSHTKNEGIL